jgi:hypothetical protein
MTRGLKARGEHATDIAVVVDDKNVSQANPRLAVQVPFYCSTGQQHQEPARPHRIASCTTRIAKAVALRISDLTKRNQIMRNHCGLHLAH